MQINVLFFASLREQFNQSSHKLTAEVSDVQQVWEAVSQGQALPNGIKVSVNQVYASLNTPVKDGDEVAFFPPVTGG